MYKYTTKNILPALAIFALAVEGSHTKVDAAAGDLSRPLSDVHRSGEVVTGTHSM